MKVMILICAFLLTWININAQVEVINNPEWGSWQNREDSVLSFDLIQVYGTDYPDDSAIFSSANGIWSVDSDEFGNLYVLDNDANMLVKFSPDGEVIWKVDQKGKGPGDLFVPNGLAVGDFIYVSNLIGTRLDVFSKEGRFIKSINSDIFGKKDKIIVGIIDDRYLVIKSKIPSKMGVQVGVLDIQEQYEKVTEFDAIEDVEFDIPASGFIYPKTTIVDGLIVIAKTFSYGHKYYNIDGTLLKETNREFSRFMRPGFAKMGNTPMMIPLSNVYGQHKIGKEYLLSFVHWPSKIDDPDKAVSQMSTGEFPELGSNSSLDLYESNGKLLYSIERVGLIPEIGWLKHADDSGYLYTVVGVPYPQVRKYKVNVHE